MRSSRFTLVELLIVIGIIAILAGILLPVISGAAKRADMTKAKAEITTLVNAIKQFESTYGHLPLPTGYDAIAKLNDDQYEDLIRILQGEDPVNGSFGSSTPPPNPNTRRTRFLDVVGNTRGRFQDPWGSNYFIYMDHDYDGKIDANAITNNTDKIVRGYSSTTLYFDMDLYYSIIIWSQGANTSDGSVSAILNDNVYSFPVIWDRDSDSYKISN